MHIRILKYQKNGILLIQLKWTINKLYTLTHGHEAEHGQ